MIEALYKKTVAIMAVAGIVSMTAVTLPALAVDPLEAACKKNPSAEICSQRTDSGAKVENIVQNIISLLLFVLGTICIIVIIVAGIQYAVASGDSNQLTRAKNSILYAVVGLVVAILSYSIVNFVLFQFK